MRRKTGFTLIELLIVVAIIGILAAIAVPNFLNAQIRAKVAKAVSNMRSIETAMEMYNLDKGTYPRWAWDSFGNASHYMGFRDLTTPIGYISGDAAFKNPFKADIKRSGPSINSPFGGELDPFFELATWKASGNEFLEGPSGDTFPRNVWLLESAGPDRGDDYDASTFPAEGPVYQPSNGLHSNGDIFRAGGAHVPEWAATLTY